MRPRASLLFLYLLLAVGLAACGPSRHQAQVGPPPLPLGPVEAVGSHAVCGPVGSNRATLDRYREAVVAHVASFQALEGVEVPYTLVVVQPNLTCGEVYPALGCWRGSSTVEVVPGFRDELPALYHELAHRVFRLYHVPTDPKNVEFWERIDQRGYEVARELRWRRMP